MYIQKKPATIILKALIGLLSMWLLWYLVTQFGPNCFRLFPTWVLSISAIYFSANALVIGLSTRKFNGKIISPMFEGLMIVNFFLMSGMAFTSAQYHFYLPDLPIWFVGLVCIVMPLMVFVDWILFVKKGAWRPISPLYWLSLSACYAATMIFATQVLPEDAELRFPLAIFNYIENGIPNMLIWMFVIAFLILAGGYALYILDFAMSGKLAKKIVMPHLQVVEVDENGEVIEQSKAVIDEPKVVKTTEDKAPSKSSKTNPVKANKTPQKPNNKSNKTKDSTSSKTSAPEIIKVETSKVDHQVQHKTTIKPKAQVYKSQSTEDKKQSNNKPSSEKPSSSPHKKSKTKSDNK